MSGNNYFVVFEDGESVIDLGLKLEPKTCPKKLFFLKCLCLRLRKMFTVSSEEQFETRHQTPTGTKRPLSHWETQSVECYWKHYKATKYFPLPVSWKDVIPWYSILQVKAQSSKFMALVSVYELYSSLKAKLWFKFSHFSKLSSTLLIMFIMFLQITSDISKHSFIEKWSF